jgi:geranylgeranyl diphosphate synthase, type I
MKERIVSEINSEEMRVAIETELKHIVFDTIPAEYQGMRSMLAYHLGWEGVGAGPEAQGKRIRPILLLLCNAAAGGDWYQAVPAAAAVELIHNFSLIHDDIQDQSTTRRGRNTVWVNWGIAQAINAGDLMFTQAFSALHELKDTYQPDILLEASNILQQTCIRLTGGQYLDLAYEQDRLLPSDAYWPMVSGKTAALLTGCTRLGALLAGAELETVRHFAEFGEKLGLSFQVQDDWLGIWGNSALTGKSTASDLVAGKKSLPVVLGLENKSNFSSRWLKGGIQADEVSGLAELLVAEGIEKLTRKEADRLTLEALQALDRACPPSPGKNQLISLVKMLLKREY